ncbi:MAG TPA: HAD-IB family phosphatase [Candidatus Binataceae bacterium]|nr:HAD-IB family phosphatase [Candidatus Binataceae bacterium]
MSVQSNNRSRKSPPVTRGAAFYDLDGTLTDLNLLHTAAFFASNLAQWGGRLNYVFGLVGRLPRIMMAEMRDRHLLNVTLFESFKGISRDRLELLGDEYAERYLAPRLYPQALEIIERNREIGFEPVLVSGSPDFVILPLCRRLKIASFAANQLMYFRNHATGQLREPVMAGQEKTAWCIDYAAERGINLAQCWGYADSHYDLPFLTALGHPVAVNPDRRLEASARSRQWPIVRFARAGSNGGGASR